MSAVSPRTARLAALIGVPVALVASGAVVSTASYSAFSSTTENPTSNWATGSVALTDDDGGAGGSGGTALFSATNLKPGSTDAKCITVTSTGTLPSTVKLYGTGASSTKDLAANTTLTVEQGTGGSFGSCTGFTPATTGGTLYNASLAGFATAHSNYANATGGWVTAGGTAAESRTYRISYTVSPTLANTSQGASASLGFTWEAQNN
ncbi:hypothetical protein [Frigoribacterium salinisoli]